MSGGSAGIGEIGFEADLEPGERAGVGAAKGFEDLLDMDLLSLLEQLGSDG